MEKPKWLQMRLTPSDEAILEELTAEYGLDRSNLIRRALDYIRQTKPTFKIAPQGKERALAGIYQN